MRLSKVCFFCLLAIFFMVGDVQARQMDFARFSMDLPEGWDGDEQTGFVSDNPEEYQLTLGKKDDGGDHFLAQVSIFMLPNKDGIGARDAALRLAEAQGGSSEPVEEDGLWTFSGEPRSRIISGMAKTYVNATPKSLLIIIAQDPQNLGSEDILKSLRATDSESRILLGRQSSN